MTTSAEAIQQMQINSIRENVPKWSLNMGRNFIWAERCCTQVPIDWKKTTVVFASGASLSRYSGELQKLNDADVTAVATPTNVKWLQEQGVEIDLVVVMDAHAYMGKYLENYSGPIIANPCVDVSVSSKRTYFHKLYLTGFDVWNMTQDGMFPRLRNAYPAEYGCVPNMAFALVHDLSGSENIVLAGLDNCYWNDYARIEDPLQKVEDAPDHIEWRGKKTNHAMVAYKDAWIRIWAQAASKGRNVFLMSQGIIDEAPSIELKGLLKGKFPEPPTFNEIVERTEKHLEEYKAFGEVVMGGTDDEARS